MKFEQQVKDEQLRFHELEVHTSVLQQKVDELQDHIDRGDIATIPNEATAIVVDHSKTGTTGTSGKEGTPGTEGEKKSSISRTRTSTSNGILSVSTPMGK